MQPLRVIEQEPVPDAREPAQLGSGRVVGHGEEAEPVPELVEHDREQLDLAALVAVHPVVPALRQAGRAADAGVEGGRDVGAGRIEIRVRELVGLGDVVPGAGERRAPEVAEDVHRARAAEHAARGVAAERVEVGVDQDRDVVRQQRAPDVGRVLEDEQALGADGGAGVAAHRGHGGGIVEALPRAIQVDDRERGRGRGAGQRDQGERGQRGEGAEKAESRAHDYFSSSGGTGRVRSARRRAFASSRQP